MDDSATSASVVESKNKRSRSSSKARSGNSKKKMSSGGEAVVREDMVLFWKPPCCFGQWSTCSFVVEGQEYNCAEQFMMAEKARLFKDEDVLKQILETDDPKYQKALGRLVKNFDEEIWKANCMSIVEKGNYAKFSQTAELKKQLLDTGDKLLVEASPLDKVWGIGLGASNPLAWKKTTWRGSNLLGYALMNVRARLREEEAKM